MKIEVVYERNYDRVLTPDELKALHFFGLELKDARGRDMPDESLQQYIDAATELVERTLEVKFHRQIIEETSDFNHSEFRNWSYVDSSHPIVCPINVVGYVSEENFYEFPDDWLDVKRSNIPGAHWRHVNVRPTSGAGVLYGYFYLGVVPNILVANFHNIPNYWRLTYVTGVVPVPPDVVQLISNIATMQILLQLADVVLAPGIASQSISLDGLSQSVSASSPFANRIKTLQENVKEEMERLRQIYRQPSFGVA